MLSMSLPIKIQGQNKEAQEEHKLTDRGQEDYRTNGSSTTGEEKSESASLIIGRHSHPLCTIRRATSTTSTKQSTSWTKSNKGWISIDLFPDPSKEGQTKDKDK